MEKPSKIQTRYRYRNREDPVGEELEEKVKDEDGGMAYSFQN